MAVVAITVAGVDITDKCLFHTARFVSKVNGIAGTADMRVRDDDSTMSFAIGAKWLLTVDGAAVWSGFVMQVRRVYIFPAMDVAASGLQRFWDLVGSDYNLLFYRRYAVSAADPTLTAGTTFPANTMDSVAIADLVANWLDLSTDSIDTSGVTTVGAVDPAQRAQAWSAGTAWGDAMAAIAMIPAAIWYLRPSLTGATLVYCDADTATAAFGLSDAPDGTTTKGYREMEITLDGTALVNDALEWGAGYGTNRPVFRRVTDAASVAAHGTWQQGDQRTGVYKQATIDRIADSIVNGSPLHRRGGKDDRTAVTLVTYEPGLLAGDVVNFESTVWSFAGSIPVREMEVSFDAPDAPRYRLMLSSAIDSPWGFYDVAYFRWSTQRLGMSRLPHPVVPSMDGSCDCGIFDSFTRTVSGGWGTADAGGSYTWSVSSGLTPNLSVDGSQGVILAPHATVTDQRQDAPFSNPVLWPVPGDVYLDVEMQNAPAMGYNGRLVIMFASNNSGTLSLWTSDGVVVLDSPRANFDPGYEATGITLTGPLSLRLQADAAGYRAKVWVRGAAEPGSWTVADTWQVGNAETGLCIGFSLRQGATSTAYQALVDNIRVIPSTGEVTRCLLPQFDDFSRTTASGWGTATPSGYAWSGTYQADTVPGHARVTDSAVSNLSVYEAAVGPWGHGEFTMTTTVRFDNAANSFARASFYTGGALVGPVLQLDANGDSVTLVGGNAANSAVASAFGWASATVYRVKLHVIPGTTAEARVWVDGTPEPGAWLLTVSDVGGAPLTSDTYYQWSVRSIGTSPCRALIGPIDFDYTGRPCYYDGATPVAASGVPSSGWGCEALARQSATVYSATRPFAGGATIVWVDGVLQVPQADYTEDPTGRTVTFAGSVPSTAVVRMCYFVLPVSAP